MSTARASQMQEAVTERRHLRRQLPKSLCGATSISKSFSARQTQSEWDNFRPIQAAYLDNEVKILRLGACGEPIPDYSTRCKHASVAPSRDLAYEVEQLFPLVVARPTVRLREFLNKRSVSHQRAAWARKTIITMLRAPITSLFEMADTLAEQILNNLGKRTDPRIHAALTRVLMYLSDCWRYTLDHVAAKNAAQMLQILSPGDPQAHLRLGMNLAMLGNGNDAIRPFFHYCVFLANRQVDVDHNEAVIVSNFVKTRGRPDASEKPESEEIDRRTFFAVLIDTLWTLLCESYDEAESKAKHVRLWDALGVCLREGVSADDMMNIVGVIIFTHHRCSPKGSPTGKLLSQCELADYVVGRLVHIVCNHILVRLQVLNQELQKRKRNRRRAMQKKRRNDSSVVDRDRDVAIGYEVFAEKVDLDAVVPELGAVSLLAHYWSKARSAPSPTLDMKPLGRTLKVLKGVMSELERLEQLTCTGPLAMHIESKILDGVGGRIPAMPEDLRFCHFLPCGDYHMFHQTALQEVPLPSVLKPVEDGIIRPALKAMGDNSYESLVAVITQRHLDAFSILAVKEAMANDLGPKLEKRSACILVCMTVRKCRIRRLVRDLEKVGGGHLSRMSLESSCEQDRDEALANAQESARLPSPGQPRSSVPEHEDSFHARITPGELDVRVRKRRRLLGTCTAPIMQSLLPGSQSHESIEERQDHSNELAEEDTTIQGNERIAASSPMVGEKRTREQREEHRTPVRRHSHGTILSQGSLQLTYAQPAQPAGHQTSSDRQQKGGASEIHLILRNFFYPPRNENDTMSSGSECLAGWRKPPNDDWHKNIFNSQPLCSDG